MEGYLVMKEPKGRQTERVRGTKEYQKVKDRQVMKVKCLRQVL
jgi:hypothetical protein